MCDVFRLCCFVQAVATVFLDMLVSQLQSLRSMATTAVLFLLGWKEATPLEKVSNGDLLYATSIQQLQRKKDACIASARDQEDPEVPVHCSESREERDLCIARARERRDGSESQVDNKCARWSHLRLIQ